MPPSSQPVYAIRLERVENQVVIEINGKKIDTGVLPDSSPSNILVPLDSTMAAGKNYARVQVYNTVSRPGVSFSPWQVRYQIEINGLPVGVIEYSGGYTKPGLVLELQHSFVWPYDPQTAPDYDPSVSLY